MRWAGGPRTVRGCTGALALCLLLGCSARTAVSRGDDPIRTPAPPSPSRHEAPVTAEATERADRLVRFVRASEPRLNPWSWFTFDERADVAVGANARGEVLVWSPVASSSSPWGVPVGDVGDPTVTLSSDGSRLAVTNQDNTLVSVWDTSSRANLVDIGSDKGESILAVRFAADHSFFVTSTTGALAISFAHFGERGRPRVITTGPYWFPTSGDGAGAVRAGTDELVNVSSSDDVTHGDHDRTGYSAWTPGSRVQQVDLGCDPGGAEVAADGRLVACMLGTDTVRVWDVQHRTELTRWRLPPGSSGPGVFFADDRGLAVEEDVALPHHQVRPTLTLYDVASHAVVGQHAVEPAPADAAPVLRPLTQGAALLYSRPRPSESTSIDYAFPVPTL